jgi:F-type H+-transporting ATPase subunit b
MTSRRIALPLTFVSALFMAGPSLGAQAHEAPAAAETHNAEPHEGAPAAHESAGHEGAEAHGAHHGPEVKFLGKPMGTLGQFILRVINFGIFGGLLFFILKGPLSAAFKARAKELEELLNQAEKDKAEGEAQLKELEAKMAGLQAELAGILAKTEADSESERQRILETARAEAEAILAQAKTEIDFQKRLAEKELRALVATLAVEGATKRLEIQLQGETAGKILDRAIEKVGGVK